MSKREKAAACLATAAVFVLLLAGTVSARITIAKYETRTHNEYKNSLYGLSQNVSQIDMLLEEGMCTSSVKQFSKIASMLESQAQQAKLLLSRLPVSSGSTDEISRFLSQVGDYSLSISGERLTDENYETLGSLWESAGSLRLALEELIARADDGGWEQELASLNAVFDGGEIPSGLDGAAQEFTAVEELVYDGPFSDHVFSRKPAALEGAQGITIEQAQESARKMTDSELEYVGEEKGAIPAYVFEGEDVEISVCSAGGDVVYMLGSREKGSPMLDAKTAAERADAFVLSCGYEDMVRIGGTELGDRCVFNYAYTMDGIVCYPDQIKVTVSLDNGDICGFDTRDYLMNHTERKFQGAVKSQEDARQVLSDRLRVTSCRMAVIMSEGLEESLCYEFECESEEGTQALVSINAMTLEEEKVEVVHGENELSSF